MMYLKRFNEGINYDDFIDGTYTITNGLIDVIGDVSISGYSKLPVMFGKVSGSFFCDGSDMTTLDGCPVSVGRHFGCYKNKLTSLEGCPISVGGYFSCFDNNLTSLKGSPKYVGDFIDCRSNKLYDFYGIGDFGGDIRCYDNPLYEIYELCHTKEFMGYLNEFRPIRGKTILGKRLQECLYMCDKDIETILKFKNYTLLE